MDELQCVRDLKEEVRQYVDVLKAEIERLKAENKKLQKKIVWGFYEDEYPIYTQGDGHPELGSPITADEANNLVDIIRKYRGVELDDN